MGSIPRFSVLLGERRQTHDAPLCLHLERASRSFPKETALLYKDETCSANISYYELEATTNTLARAIAKRAQRTGANRDRDYVVAVCMQPTHDTILTLLATWKAGAAYVPMEPSFPQTRISHILNDAEPALIVYDDSANPAMFTGSGVSAVSFEELCHECSGVSNGKLNNTELLAQSTAESIGIILYTSGSTGIPKGVRLSYSAVCNRLWWQYRTFPFSATEKTCVWKTALTFVDSVCEIWGPLLHGRTLVILPKQFTRDPQKLVKVLNDHQIERLVLVPTLLQSILMYLHLHPSDKLEKLKLWVCSGETLSKDLAARFFECFEKGYKLANFYGSTEVMGDVTYCVLEGKGDLERHHTIPIGSPIDNCAVYLLDEEMNPVVEGETGEVWVGGRNLATGYVGGQAPDKFVDNPHADHTDLSRLYRTGDFGIVEKGVILFAGRTDSQVKIRGNRVDLQEVERAVIKVEGIDKCVVLCYGLDRGQPEVLAFVTLQPEARLSARHIENLLKDHLTQYMMPQVIVIESVPLLVNGKVDRQALLKMYENTNNNDDSEIPIEIDYSGVKPEDMTAAKVLFETVGEVLGRAARGAISVRTGFYDLGGNSLNSIYTITKLREQGYYVDISDFLGASTLGEVLANLSTSPHSAHNHDGPRFTAEPMRDDHKERVIDMIVTSFYEKAELEQFVKHELAPRDYAHIIDACWSALLQARLSVVLRDDSNTLVAVALNFDAHDEPELEISGGLAKIMDFLEHVESSVRDKLPEGKGTVLHSFMMATASTLKPRDNVAAIRALEDATMTVARGSRFKGVFTTNTSPLTQQLGRDVLGFETLLDYQLNQYVDSKGNRVFGEAGDDMRAIVCWKPVELVQ